MRYLIFLLALIGCSTTPKVVQDPNPASVDMGWKRVETEVCGNYGVGENGCLLKDGQASGSLKIYRILKGTVNIIGQGCNVDKSFKYEYDAKSEWIDLPLADLVGPTITDACVLSIYQNLEYNGAEKIPYPVRGIYGTVSLIACPANNKCRFTSEQVRAGWQPKKLEFSDTASGKFLLRGCGKEVVPVSDFNGPLSFDLQALYPDGYPSVGKNGCMFALGVRGPGEERYRYVHRLWIYKEETIKLFEPTLSEVQGEILFEGDKTVSLTMVGSKIFNSSKGKYVPSADGDMLRFYTIQGRTLIVFVKDGKIQWSL